MNYPGFEPGSTAWKAAILTTRLIIHWLQVMEIYLLLNFWDMVGQQLQKSSLSQTPGKIVPVTGFAKIERTTITKKHKIKIDA